MARKVVGAGVAVLALAFALAGCGGSSESEPLTRAEFAQKASAICEHRAAVFAAATQKGDGDILRSMRIALPELESAVEQLGDLTPPAELRRTYAEVMAIERHHLKAGREALEGRVLASDDGPDLHRHERQRVELGMAACN